MSPIRDYVHINDISMDDLVFVLASSANHVNESMDALGSIHKYMPGHKIFYYDIQLPSGMDQNTIHMVKLAYIPRGILAGLA